MIAVTFVQRSGELLTVEAAAGDRLLDVAQAHDQPLEGTCEGQMACSTCHVIIDEAHFGRLAQASGMEEDILDLAAGARRTSRLACQIWLDATLEGLVVAIPPGARDMQRR